MNEFMEKTPQNLVLYLEGCLHPSAGIPPSAHTERGQIGARMKKNVKKCAYLKDFQYIPPVVRNSIWKKSLILVIQKEHLPVSRPHTENSNNKNTII